MKINEIELTPEENNQAIQDFLKSKGIDVVVNKVSDIGYPVKFYRIECGVKEPVAVEIAPASTL